MRNLPVAGLVTAALLFVADQASKFAVTDVLQLNELTAERYVTPFFNLRFVANHGISLGLLHADTNTMRWALVAMTGAIAVAGVSGGRAAPVCGGTNAKSGGITSGAWRATANSSGRARS